MESKLGLSLRQIGGLYSNYANVRAKSAAEIINRFRSSELMHSDKQKRMLANFSGKNTISGDCIDPRILSMSAPWLLGGANSNGSICAAFTKGDAATGYIPSAQNTEKLSSEVSKHIQSLPDVSHQELMKKLLKKEALCNFLDLGSLKEYSPREHGRAAYKFFILNVIEKAAKSLQHGQLSVEISQFGPLEYTDLPGLFKPGELPDGFLGQFEKPTIAEMVADGIIMDGGYSNTLVKVAVGTPESYTVISKLSDLGLAPNATLGFPTLAPYTDFFGHTWKYAGELAIACQLGAITHSYFIRRVIDKHPGGPEIINDFTNECIKLAQMKGSIATAASIGDKAMAEAALLQGAHIVATPPQKVGGNMYQFINWLANDVPDVAKRSVHVDLPPRNIIPIEAYLGHGIETTPSPLLRAGYGAFFHDDVVSAATVAKYIEGMIG